MTLNTWYGMVHRTENFKYLDETLQMTGHSRGPCNRLDYRVRDMNDYQKMFHNKPQKLQYLSKVMLGSCIAYI